MKSINLAMAILAICCCFCIRSSESVMEDEILKFLEELRMRMCHPLPKLGLPALDPFAISHLDYGMNNKYIIDFTGSMDNLTVTGLSDFIVNDLKISPIPLRKSTIDVTLPQTVLKTIYTAKGSLAYILNMAGNGTGAVFLKEVRLSISWSLKAGAYLGIRNFKLTLSIGDLFIDFEDLLEEERINKFFHTLVNDLGLELLDDVWQEKNEPAEKFIENKLNAFLGQYTINDILKLIGGSGGGGPIFGPDDPPGDCKDIE